MSCLSVAEKSETEVPTQPTQPENRNPFVRACARAHVLKMNWCVRQTAGLCPAAPAAVPARWPVGAWA